jgi:hypothetical protein
VLNGNHELMNAAGDLRYVTAGGFVDFAEVPGVDLADPRAASVPPAMRARLLAFAPGGPYARKLATRPVVLIVGDSVFAHGGVLPAHARRGLDAINGEVQTLAARRGGDLPGHPAGRRQPGVDAALLRQARAPATAPWPTRRSASSAVKRMVLGHTVHKDGIVRNCDGKVWCIDVGMAAYYGGHPEVLEIKGDAVTPLR